MIVSQNIHGAMVISDIIEGYRVERQYYFFDSIEECINEFCAEFPNADMNDVTIVDREGIRHFEL